MVPRRLGAECVEQLGFGLKNPLLEGHPSGIIFMLRKELMKKTQQLTVVIEREGGGYVSLCPELDIASQGSSIEEARNNLIEAVELFFESASPSEVKSRLHPEVYVSQIEVSVG